MFTQKYSRMKYWIISMLLFIPAVIANNIAVMLMTKEETVLQGMTILMLTGFFTIAWLFVLSNRMRDYGTNPIFAIFAIIPLVNLFMGLFFGFAKGNGTQEDLQQKEEDLQQKEEEILEN